MAPPRKIPAIETNPGFKTTTVRMTAAQFEEIDLFARALGISMTEFLRKASDSYVKELAQDPEIRKSVQRQITRVTKMMDRIAKRTVLIDQDDDDDDVVEVDDDEEDDEDD